MAVWWSMSHPDRRSCSDSAPSPCSVCPSFHGCRMCLSGSYSTQRAMVSEQPCFFRIGPVLFQTRGAQRPGDRGRTLSEMGVLLPESASVTTKSRTSIGTIGQLCVKGYQYNGSASSTDCRGIVPPVLLQEHVSISCVRKRGERGGPS